MGDVRAPHSSLAYSFGPFRLIPAQQLLLDGDRPVRVGSRALDILVALVERAGEVVTKEELVRRVWPDTFVEEGNLRVHITALRRVLRDDQAGNRFVANIPGRGYRFIAPTLTVSTSEQPEVRFSASEPKHNLPAPLARMFGRSELVDSLVARLARQRFVTLVGPGGIGKTVVALVVANNSLTAFKGNVRFVDLAPLSDPALVPSALAAVLGVPVRSQDPLPALLAHLANKEMLLVFDNCEHVIDTAAALAEGIFKGAPKVRILATSREPLRAEGEVIVRLGALGLPSGTAATAAEALTYPAIQLFVERASACVDDFELTDDEADIVTTICHRLDGIPLAIELATGRLDAFGVRGLADHLVDRFGLLTRGRRTALPRHQTLRSTLDWSHELLSGDQKKTFRRLGVFAGWFTSEAAGAVICTEGLSASEAIGALADLVAKSLVAADVEGPTAYYRLLDTTRAYAVERLKESDEHSECARRHAEYFCELCERFASGDNSASRSIDDIRGALAWVFSTGDNELAVRLASAAVDVWSSVSLLVECQEWSARAIVKLGGLRSTAQEMRLQCGLGLSLMFTKGMTDNALIALERALHLSEALDNTDYQLRTLYALWLCWGRAREPKSGAFAEKYHAIAMRGNDQAAMAKAHWMAGASQHYAGEHTKALANLQSAVDRYSASSPRRQDLTRFATDVRISSLAHQAMSYWLQGFPDKATEVGQLSISEARVLENPVNLVLALALPATFIALNTGERRVGPPIHRGAHRDGGGPWTGALVCLRALFARHIVRDVRRR